MAAKKRKSKARVKKARPVSKKRKKTVKSKTKKASKPKARRKPASKTVKEPSATPAVEDLLEKELKAQGQELFSPRRTGLMSWIRKYSPVLITLGIGLATYFFLVMYLFYPTVLLYGHYMQLLVLLVLVFLIAGILIYLGLRAELMFVRVISFIFVFVIFTFLLLFILLAYTLRIPA